MQNLKDNNIHYRHIPLVPLTSNLSKKIIQNMYTDADDVFDRQTGSSKDLENVVWKMNFVQQSLTYWSQKSWMSCQVIILKLKDIWHLESEQQLPSKEKKSTAKGIRNDYSLFLSDVFRKNIYKGFNIVVKVLNYMESMLYSEQSLFLHTKITEKMKRIGWSSN